MSAEPPTGLPSRQDIHKALNIYLDRAYGGDVPEDIARKFAIPDDCEPIRWLLEDVGEPAPADADVDTVRSVALRLGNAEYPNMKMRFTRPPGDRTFLLIVDSHDIMLKAPEGTPDHEALEELKSANAAIARDVTSAWDAAGLPTERNYLREKIRRARRGG